MAQLLLKELQAPLGDWEPLINLARWAKGRGHAPLPQPVRVQKSRPLAPPLPTPATSFIGRQHELAEAHALLSAAFGQGALR